MVGGGILGKAVESALERRGHDVIVLSKGTGFDVTEPKTMTPRSGIDAVVEATDVFTQKFDVARDFFTTSTRSASTVNARNRCTTCAGRRSCRCGT